GLDGDIAFRGELLELGGHPAEFSLGFFGRDQHAAAGPLRKSGRGLARRWSVGRRLRRAYETTNVDQLIRLECGQQTLESASAQPLVRRKSHRQCAFHFGWIDAA